MLVASVPVAKSEAIPVGQATAGAPQNGQVPPVAKSTEEEPKDKAKKLVIFLNTYDSLYKFLKACFSTMISYLFLAWQVLQVPKNSSEC